MILPRNPRLDLLKGRLERSVQLGLLALGVAQRIRMLAMMLDPIAVSGEELGGALGVSRAAVHKHVSVLRTAGFAVESQRGYGYRLREMPELPAPELVALLLLADPRMPGPDEPGFLGLPYHHHARVDSTNDICRSLAEAQAPSGTVVAAEDQLQGRGRLDRVWHSLAGRDLTFSVILRPNVAPVEVGRLVLAVANGVALCLAEDVGLGRAIGLKWPNDVLINGDKACGILLEASIDMDRVRWVVVGIGINTNSRSADLLGGIETPPGKEPPISLHDAVGSRVSRSALLVSLLARLSVSLRQLSSRPESVVEQYEAFDTLRGRGIYLTSGYGGRRMGQGIADGVESDGSLRVRGTHGQIDVFGAGEVTVVPAEKA
ncbi:MAG: biotin--[acetyl-CoA-carboxylase] ligase [Actinobacteria bacterium]|nr:biotin--[acetyl-CoA-carboxylase] ligase [Actinomycetota bacterium]